MCGRYTLRTPMAVLALQFHLEMPPPLPARFNIAPTQTVATIRQLPSKPRELALLTWGLVPSWAKDPSIGNRMINARSETIAEKPAFRSAFRRQRCLVLADGYYEWKTIEGKKQPYHIRMQDDAAFGFAGLWEKWKGEGENWLETCTIITTSSNALTSSIHDRMPVILHPGDYERWLDPTFQETSSLIPLLAPYESEVMLATPVNRFVSNARHEGPECLAAPDT